MGVHLDSPRIEWAGAPHQWGRPGCTQHRLSPWSNSKCNEGKRIEGESSEARQHANETHVTSWIRSSLHG